MAMVLPGDDRAQGLDLVDDEVEEGRHGLGVEHARPARHDQGIVLAPRRGAPRHAAEVDPKAVTRSLLAGLLSHLGMREETGPRSREYAGARGAKFADERANRPATILRRDDDECLGART